MLEKKKKLSSYNKNHKLPSRFMIPFFLFPLFSIFFCLAYFTKGLNLFLLVMKINNLYALGQLQAERLHRFSMKYIYVLMEVHSSLRKFSQEERSLIVN